MPPKDQRKEEEKSTLSQTPIIAKDLKSTATKDSKTTATKDAKSTAGKDSKSASVKDSKSTIAEQF